MDRHAEIPQPPAWLADPALGRLWDAARTRLERSHLTPVGRVRLTSLERPERHAIGGLLARPVVRGGITVDLAELERVLAQRSPYHGLAQAVAAITGSPLRDRKAERSAAAAAREAPLAVASELLAADPAFAQVTWAADWLTGVRRSGLLARASDPSRAVRSAIAVLAAVLPGRTAESATVARTELAARTTGSAHGLDDGTATAHLVLRALALDAGRELPASVAARRELWERYGVLADSVSSTCLTLGLLARGTSGVATRLRLAAGAGDPVHLTPRDLRDLALAGHRKVLVCENPRVLEAVADRFGGSVPVVCTAGRPALVATDLLGRLASSGVMLRYHGDFDWPGITLANALAADIGVLPLRMSAADYQAAVRSARAVLELTGPTVAASWDKNLEPVMSRMGVAVHEEAVLDDILTAIAP
jgi:uncharacterized protein (TIGR02679 family)